MPTQTYQPPMSTTSVPSPETAPVPVASRSDTEVVPRGDEVRPYWGDRLFLLFCLGCALLIMLMNGYDFLKGLFGN